MSTNYYK